MSFNTVNYGDECMCECFKTSMLHDIRILPVPVHEKAVAPYPPIPSTQQSPPQPQKSLGTEEGSHETLSHVDLRCGGLQVKPETCVLQYHKKFYLLYSNKLQPCVTFKLCMQVASEIFNGDEDSWN
jgi:hypothetical protein